MARMKLGYVQLLFCLALVLTVVSPAVADSADSQSLTEVNKELSNPISSIWALQLQQNTYWLNKPDRNVVNLQFQPVLPLALTEDWNLITRPVFQVMNSTPYVNESLHLHRVTGFGDTIVGVGAIAESEACRPLAAGRRSHFYSPYREQLEARAEQMAARTSRRIRVPG